MRQYTSSVSTEPVSKFRYQNKERDLESGYDDFGGRLFDSQIGRAMQVDPKAEKNLIFSPYVSMGDNPLFFADPNGKDIIIWYNNRTEYYRYSGGEVKSDSKYVKAVIDAINYNIKNGGGDDSKTAISNHDIEITICETDLTSEHVLGTVYWNPNLGLLTDQNILLSPETVLDHELSHGVLYYLFHSLWLSLQTHDKEYGKKEDKRVITGPEQKTARANGEIQGSQVTRKNHKGQSVYVRRERRLLRIDWEKTGLFWVRYDKWRYKTLDSELHK